MEAEPAEKSISGELPPFRQRLIEVAAVFGRLGFTAFGGPAAHVAMMEEIIVARRKWLDRRQFLDAYAAINFIPGPNSTELAIYLGWVRAGIAGLVTAGTCFIVPAVLIIIPIAWAYVRFGQIVQVRGMMAGVNAAVIAIIASACVRFATTALRNGFDVIVAAGAFVACALLICFPVGHLPPDLSVLALAAVAGIMRHKGRVFPAMMPILAAQVPSALTVAPAAPLVGGLPQLAGVFLKIGATLFGSGYLLVAYLQTSVADQYHWMNQDQLASAISVGQFTPGPLLTTATFIGYVRGWQIFKTIPGAVAGALVATAAIFSPAFVLIAILGRFLSKLRESEWARAALDAVNAAVVSLIAVAAMRLGVNALKPLPDRHLMVVLVVFIISIIALLKYNVNATWLIAVGAIAGLAVTIAAV